MSSGPRTSRARKVADKATRKPTTMQIVPATVMVHCACCQTMPLSADNAMVGNTIKHWILRAVTVNTQTGCLMVTTVCRKSEQQKQPCLRGPCRTGDLVTPSRVLGQSVGNPAGRLLRRPVGRPSQRPGPRSVSTARWSPWIRFYGKAQQRHPVSGFPFGDTEPTPHVRMASNTPAWRSPFSPGGGNPRRRQDTSLSLAAGSCIRIWLPSG